MLPCLDNMFEPDFNIDFFIYLFFNPQTENPNSRRLQHHCFVSDPHQSRLQPLPVTSFHLPNSTLKAFSSYRLSASVTPPTQSLSETHLTSCCSSSSSHSCSLPRPFITSVAAEAGWQRAFTRRHSPQPIDHGHCFGLGPPFYSSVFMKRCICHPLSVTSQPQNSPSHFTSLSLLPSLPSLPLSLYRLRSPADIFTSTPSSISHFQCPPMPASIVEGSKLMAERPKSWLEWKSGRVTQLLCCRTPRTNR